MGTSFDRCRSVRYQQLLQQQRQLQQKKQRLNAIQVKKNMFSQQQHQAGAGKPAFEALVPVGCACVAPPLASCCALGETALQWHGRLSAAGCCVQGNSAYRPELEPSQQAQTFAHLPPEQQQALEEENRALVSELSSLNRSARGIESTMRELAQLSQMFSAQVMNQAEQIEQLYQEVGHASPSEGLWPLAFQYNDNSADSRSPPHMPVHYTHMIPAHTRH